MIALKLLSNIIYNIILKLHYIQKVKILLLKIKIFISKIIKEKIKLL